MMRSCLLIGTLYLTVWARYGAAQTDPAKVRAAIHLPHISVQFKIEFDPPGKRLGATSVIEPDAAAGIAELQKSLKGSPSDAAIFVRIAESYAAEAPGLCAKGRGCL